MPSPGRRGTQSDSTRPRRTDTGAEIEAVRQGAAQYGASKDKRARRSSVHLAEIPVFDDPQDEDYKPSALLKRTMAKSDDAEEEEAVARLLSATEPAGAVAPVLKMGVAAVAWVANRFMTA